MVERWIGNYGAERTRKLLEANNCAPALSGYLLDPQRAEEATRSLQQTGTRIFPGKFLRDSWIFDGGNPGASKAVRQSWIALQDEASQAVAHLVAADIGNSVLDLCAAPGGKTLMLARTVGPLGHVIAADLHEHRVRATRERLESAGVRNVETLGLDGSQPLPFERSFDRILVDVPCSGTGTLARHPEIRWKILPGDLSELRARQTALLRNALPHLVPGGRLVYSTCSLEPEENELVVREVLDAMGASFQIMDSRPLIEKLLRDTVSAATVVSGDHFFRTFPPEHGTDGFFAAVIERRR
jgi:16S rRNA (cytosine967-C5)-methyltransferase